jgi:hypothetical protein
MPEAILPVARTARQVLSCEQEGASWDQEGRFYGQDNLVFIFSTKSGCFTQFQLYRLSC